MSLLANSTDSCSGLSGLLSSSPGVRRRQLSRAKAIHEGRRFDSQKSRQHRNALYRSKLALTSPLVSEGTKKTLEENPLQYGLPRAFIIRLGGEDILNSGINNRETFVNEGHTIFFAGFGVAEKPVSLNGSWIEQDHVKMSPDRSTYTIMTTDKGGSRVEMYLDFSNLSSPTGHITSFDREDRSDYLLSLEPYAVYFNVSISMDAGAYFSQATGTFQWDEGSDQWKNAHWENNGMIFGYDTVAVPSPFGTPTMVNEVSFQDSLDSEHPFQLTKSQYPQAYMCVMDGTKQSDAVWMSLRVNDGTPVPSPSTSRSTQAVKSVYPENAVFKFNEFGDCFVGAYKASQSETIYAVRGSAISPGQVGTEPGLLLPPDDFEAPAYPENKKLFTSSIKPVPHAFSLATAGTAGTPEESNTPSQLSVTPLINLSPMQLAPAGSPTQYYDAVAKTANNDFHDIICYHMDPKIRKTFIQNDPYDLKDPVVKGIANDSIDNAPFYQTLQVPYVVSSLGHSTLDEAKYCNANRAEKQLQELPANSPVYKRHSDALYRYRFQEKFGLLQSYLDDQSQNDYSGVMLKVGEFLKENLKSRSKGVSDPEALDKALADIDQLCKWAIENKLYWAFQLYYWCQSVYLPTLIGQLSSGTLSTQVPMKIKALNAVFGMLEGNQINPNGKTFQQVFNEEMRMYQMAFVIPQMVDHEGHAEDFDSILKAMLNEFYENNINNPDPAIAKQAQIAKALAANQAACQGLFNNIVASMRLAGTLGSWAYIQQVFGNLNEAAGWFQGLVNGAEMAGMFTLVTCAISMCFANIGGSWKDMTPGQRANFVTTGAVLLLTFTIKFLKGLISLKTFWGDLAGFYDCFRVFVGAPAVFRALPSAASKVESGLARWFIRTGEEAMAIEGEEMTFWLRLFGRNAGEFLTNFCGAVLAISTIVLCAIDIANTSDPLQITFDALMIASSSFQLLAIGAGWLMSAGFVTSETGVALLTTAVSWMGPIALVLAFAGLIVMIVSMCLHKDPPNPIKEFVDNEASKAKLKMEFGTEIDYMNAIPKDNNHISLNGITFTADASHMLHLGQSVPGESKKYSVQTTSKVTHLPDTCWAVKTSSNGITSVFTYVVDSKGNRMTVYLSETEGGEVFALPTPAKYYTDSAGNSIPVDPAVYLAQLQRQTWDVQCSGDVQNETRMVDGKTVTYPQTANFQLFRGSKKLYIEAGSNRIRLGNPSGSDLAKWKLSLVAIGPPPFTYVKSTWALTTRSTDEVNLITYQGDASVPLTWSIKPDLPSWLSASHDGIGGGDLRQVQGVQPPEMPAKTFVVTGSINIAGQLFEQSTSVTISVMAAPAKQAGEDVSRDKVSGRKVTTNAHEQTHEYDNFTETEKGLEWPQNGRVAGISSHSTFFSWTQSGAINLDEHYTTQMSISAAKQHVDSRWYIAGQDFRDLYFPDRGPVPPNFSNDNCDYHRAGNAFVSQAISNGDSHAQPYCNWSATQTAIDEFNKHIWEDNCERYVNWLTWDQSNQITGSHCSLEEYQAMLTNPDWVSERAAEQASGTWINQSLDMFLHFAKLTALGATNELLSAVYETLVTRTNPTQPILDRSGFSDITPSTWKTYRGYLIKNQVTYGKLGVSNLNQSRTVYTPGPEPGEVYTNVYYADIDFLSTTEFHQDPPSGSCFSGNTHVVLPDGVSTKRIDELQPGDLVLSPSAENPHGTKQCLFISRPKRGGRKLYSFVNEGTAVFTATHPFHLGFDSHNFPVLGFVDPVAAVAVNPLWAAFSMKKMPDEDIVQVIPSPGPENDTLYDIIFQSSDKLPSNYVIAGAKGSQVRVCSDAPNPATLPSVARFVASLVRSIAATSGADNLPIDCLNLHKLDIRRRICEIRWDCVQKTSAMSETVSRDSINMKDMIDAFASGGSSAQALADFAEAVVTNLGFALQVEMDNARQILMMPQNDGQQSANVLGIHFIQLEQSLPSERGDKVRVFQEHCHEIEIFAPQQLGASYALDEWDTPQSTTVSGSSLGPLLYRLYARRSFQKKKSDSAYQLPLRVGQLRLVAVGHLHGPLFTRWALYDQDDGSRHMGWLGVTELAITRAAFDELQEEDEVSFSLSYAAVLGEHLGMQIASSVHV